MLIAADTFFINNKTIKLHDIKSVYPSKKDDDALKLNLDKLLKISQLQAKAIDETYLKVSNNLSNILKLDHKSYEKIIRVYYFSITNIFFDRAIRILHLKKKFGVKKLKVIEVDKFKQVDLLSEIISNSFNNWHFNQDITMQICESLKIRKKKLFNIEDYPEYPKFKGVKNHMFLSGKKEFLSRGLHKISNLLPIFENQIPAFGLTYDSFYLKKNGICGPFGIIKDFSKDHKIITKNINLDQRNKGENCISELINKTMNQLLIDYDSNFELEETYSISSIFSKIFMKYIPTSIYESANQNMNNYYKFIRKIKSKYIFGTELGRGHDSGLFICAAAKELNKVIIGYQHGGHYGYIEDNSSSAQLENNLFDYYATWGWSEIDNHFPQCKTFILPVPAFSEKNLQKDLSYKKINTHDILFLSNKIHRFAQVATSGQSRIDFIEEYMSLIEEFMSECRKRKYMVLHKLFDSKTKYLLNDFFHSLKDTNKKYYSIYETNEKGLTNNILSKANIILWDQIGTGTLQCFTSNIPTMVLWKRIYSRESKSAFKLVDALERTGVIHRTNKSLLDQYDIYQKDRVKWMHNEERILSIKNFCEKYSKTDANWQKIWYKKFNSFFD